jgi:hypothetical protein
MKNFVLFSLLGGGILFGWQFLSWAMPNFHESAVTYTPLQDQILTAIQEAGLQEGMYMLGQPDPSLMQDMAKYEESAAQYEGKPWAVINYKSSNTSTMGTNMLRGFVVCILIAAMLFWMMQQLKTPSLKNHLLLSLGIGFIGFLFVPYTNFVWFKEPDVYAYLLDGIAPWLLLGWLGNRLV